MPPDAPAYGIYAKLGWRPIEEFIGPAGVDGDGCYVAFVPTSVRKSDLNCRLVKTLLKVRKKRPVIDMYDNECMVRRTVKEFQSVNTYKASLRQEKKLSPDSK